MKDNVGTFCVFNGMVKPSAEFSDSIEFGENIIYEVIRVINSVPLFFEEHYSRLKKSFELLKNDLIITKKDLKSAVLNLLESNKMVNCNVKIIVYKEEEKQNYLLFINRSYYPTREDFETGVPVSLIFWKRENPNVKIVNQQYIKAVSDRINETKAFELLLVDNDDKITEGSKSNLFFVKGTKVFTAPDEFVLKGITRQYIVDICTKLGLELVETLISTSTLAEIDGLFITGTSIKVLPVSSVDEYRFCSSTNPTVVAIRDQYDRLIEDYILNNRI